MQLVVRSSVSCMLTYSLAEEMMGLVKKARPSKRILTELRRAHTSHGLRGQRPAALRSGCGDEERKLTLPVSTISAAGRGALAGRLGSAQPGLEKGSFF